jgi:IclR family transcriptional regulator, KDG regulon repressor
MQSEEPRYLVQVVVDTAQILGAFGPQNTPLGVAELSKSSGIGRSKVHRLLDTLRYLGFVEHDEVSKKYRLGLRTFELAAAASSRFDLGPAARQALQQLALTTGETVCVGVLQGSEIIWVDSVRGFGPLRLEVDLGTRTPPNCVALGKAILAFESPERVANILARPLPALTRNSITDPERLREELNRVRESGYALDDEESFPGVRCVATPILDYAGLPVAAIAIAGSAARLSISRLTAFVQPLKETAERISVTRL